MFRLLYTVWEPLNERTYLVKPSQDVVKLSFRAVMPTPSMVHLQQQLGVPIYCSIWYICMLVMDALQSLSYQEADHCETDSPPSRNGPVHPPPPPAWVSQQPNDMKQLTLRRKLIFLKEKN